MSADDIQQMQQQIANLQLQLSSVQTNQSVTSPQSGATASNVPPVPQIAFTPHLAGVNPPDPLDLDKEHRTETWKLWKQQWNNYMMLTNLSSLDGAYQRAMLENCLGPTALKMYNLLEYSANETNDIKTICAKMERAIIGELNETYERNVFNSRNQKPDEPFDTFLNEIKELAKTCEFCDC